MKPEQFNPLLDSLIDEVAKTHPILSYRSNPDSPFIPGETPVHYSGPFWDKEELKAAVHSLFFGKWLSSGESVAKFEKLFCKKFNQKYGVMVNSGSSANLVMIGALKKYFGWQDGDEIIVSPVGFPTTISAIVQNGLKPNFVDIEFITLNFDTSLMESKMTSRTKAIFVSPVLGNPPNIDHLIDYCERYNLKLILDGCDSLGSKWDGKFLSDYCVATSNSFYPAHHISTGEGGLVSSNIEEIVDIARSLAWWGRDCYCIGSANLLACGTCGKRFSNWLDAYDGVVDHKYIFNNIGYNLKPLDLQGAIGIKQLNKIDEIHKLRQLNYDTFFDAIEFLPVEHAMKCQLAEPAWFGFPIICESKEQKTKLVNHLEKNKIQTRNYFAGNILLHPGYTHLDDYKKYPEANKVLDLVFFIGVSPHYTKEMRSYVGSTLKHAFD